MAKGWTSYLAGAAGAAGLLLVGTTAFASPTEGRDHRLTIHHHRLLRPLDVSPVAAPIVVPLDDSGVFFQTPFSDVTTPDGGDAIVRVPHYVGPYGYDDLSDLSNDIQGTPCGRACTARSLVRWGYVPAD